MILSSASFLYIVKVNFSFLFFKMKTTGLLYTPIFPVRTHMRNCFEVSLLGIPVILLSNLLLLVFYLSGTVTLIVDSFILLALAPGKPTAKCIVPLGKDFM